MRFTPAILVLLLFSIAAILPLGRESRIGGTFIGAIIAEDGIVLGADSRSTFLDEDGRALGYIDGTQKLYASNSTGVAVSGLTSVEGELFGSFVEKSSFLLQRTPDEALFGMSVWLPYRNSTGVLLLSGGYVEGKPKICMRSVVIPMTCRASGFMTNQPSPSLSAWASSLRSAPKAGAAAAALKQAIQASAAGDVKVGGAITIVALQPRGAPMRIENPSLPAWKTVCDILRDHRAGRAHIVATAPQSELDRYVFSAACSQ